MGTRHRGSREEARALDAYVKLLRAANAVRARVEGGLREAGLTESQLGVLEMILHLGPLRQCDIGEKLLISRANVTLVADQLAAKGWLRREPHAEDRRSNVIHLTAEGRRKIERVFPDHARRIAEAMGVLGARDQEALGRLCKELGRGVEPAGD